MTDLRVIKAETGLPDGFERLLDSAHREGVRNLEIMSSEYLSGAMRFAGPGEALFAGLVGGRLEGVGAVSRETWPGVAAMRMRRFYVRPGARRLGLGRKLAESAMQLGLQSAHMLTCNAQASAAAAPFWESLGFQPQAGGDWTHVIVRD